MTVEQLISRSAEFVPPESTNWPPPTLGYSRSATYHREMSFSGWLLPRHSSRYGGSCLLLVSSNICFIPPILFPLPKTSIMILIYHKQPQIKQAYMFLFFFWKINQNTNVKALWLISLILIWILKSIISEYKFRYGFSWCYLCDIVGRRFSFLVKSLL